MNPIPYEESIKSLIYPCKVRYKDAIESIDNDYVALLNVTQDIVWRPKAKGRFHYHFQL